VHRIGILCFLMSIASSSAAGAADEDFQCGQLSSRVFEEQNGDYTHKVVVGPRPDRTLRSLAPPSVGCLRNAALVVLAGDPVEGTIVTVLFPDGHAVGVMGKDADLDFRDGRVTVRSPIPLPGDDRTREQVPAGFRDLFLFID
jgi:hypothetical protein